MLAPGQSDAQLFGLKPPAWRGAYCCCEHHPLRDARGCGILSLSSPSISQWRWGAGRLLSRPLFNLQSAKPSLFPRSRVTATFGTMRLAPKSPT